MGKADPTDRKNGGEAKGGQTLDGEIVMEWPEPGARRESEPPTPAEMLEMAITHVLIPGDGPRKEYTQGVIDGLAVSHGLEPGRWTPARLTLLAMRVGLDVDALVDKVGHLF